jgi:hypothetical protein
MQTDASRTSIPSDISCTRIWRFMWPGTTRTARFENWPNWQEKWNLPQRPWPFGISKNAERWTMT